jgi:hypothetical protein
MGKCNCDKCNNTPCHDQTSSDPIPVEYKWLPVQGCSRQIPKEVDGFRIGDTVYVTPLKARGKIVDLGHKKIKVEIENTDTKLWWPPRFIEYRPEDD